ncbi:MAG: DnaB-like helicase C-terminal domain-containing protein [Planctomycetota bacterium]
MSRRPVQVQLGPLLDRTPPEVPEAEAALLGSLILDYRRLVDVEAEGVTADDFVTRAHGLIFEVIANLARAGSNDLVQIKTSLSASGVTEAVGGVDYLVELAESVPSATSAGYYARIVRRNATRRRLIEAAGSVIHHAYDADPTATEDDDRSIESLLADHQTRLTDLSRPSSARTTDAASAADLAYERAVNRQQAGEAPGIETGLPELDRIIGGIPAGRPTVLAARPSIGKTALALWMLWRMASRGVPVAMISMEMTEEQIGQRLLSIASGVALGQIRHADDGQWKLSDRDQLDAARRDLAKVQRDGGLHIVIEPGLTPSRLESEVRRLVTRHGVKLVCIDYLQIMGYDRQAGRSPSKYEQVSDASTAITRIGLEHNIAPLLLCQLNRENGARPRKGGGITGADIDPGVPNIEGVKDSGSIEQDCQVGICLHSPDYYWGRAARVPQGLGNCRRPSGKFIISVQKHTAGPVGVAFAEFNRKSQTFWPWKECADTEACGCDRCVIERGRAAA